MNSIPDRMNILNLIFAFVLISASLPAGLQAQESNADSAQAAQETAGITPQRESLWDFIYKGGPTMIGIAVVSTVILAFALERYFAFRRANVSTKGFSEQFQAALNEGGISGASDFLEKDPRLIARILKEALRHAPEGRARVEKAVESQASVEIGKLEKGLNLLNNLGNLAPLLGFFGTVLGMRNSFLQFVEKAAPTARDLAGGVEEALITTIAGLFVAIPAYFIYNMFIYYIDSLVIELEKNAAALLEKMKS